MISITSLVLFLSAIIIGIFAVVFGGTLFLSLPLFQILFPGMPLATLIGSIKFGSIVRNLAALSRLYDKINWAAMSLVIPLGLGSVLGAQFVTGVTNIIVPFILLVGLILSETSSSIRINQKLFITSSFLIGIYGGVFGAGIMLLIIALLQLKNLELVDVRATALALEMLLSTLAVGVFIWHDLVDWPIALVWAGGGIIGGILGGIIIKKSGSLDKRKQQLLLRTAFAIALVVSVWILI